MLHTFGSVPFYEKYAEKPHYGESMKERNFPVAVVTDKAERTLRSGNPRVYDTEIISLTQGVNNGDIVDIVNTKNRYLGSGLLSEKSKIRIRLLSDNANEIFDARFFERRVKYAVDYRKTVMAEDFDCCRLIYGEADGLPGVTVDRYSDILVSQIMSYGMEMRKDMIYEAAVKYLGESGIKINGIYERNDVGIRENEGLAQSKGWYEGLPHGDKTDVVITENSIRYNVDIMNGQKTGFFLDQKYNRLAVSKIARGKNVLDCFTHTGSFALNVALGGAQSVTAVDISGVAIDCAKQNAKLNGLEDKIDFLQADIFDLLPSLEKQGGKPYDFIILDPPAFTKSRKTVNSAQRGYKEINYRAMKLLPRGGYLATCSCSHFMGSELFEKMLSAAAKDAGVQLKMIEMKRQSPDHPILWNVPETDYLKFYIFQVI